MKATALPALLIALGLELVVASGPPELRHPDEVGLDQALAEQLRQARELIEATAEAPAATRAEAVGEAGLLYQALEFNDSALDAYRLARSLDPLDARWPYLEAIVLADRGQAETARALFLEAVSLSDRLATAAWIRLGRLALDDGRPNDAAIDFRRALSRDDTAAAALAGMGEAMLALERPGDAIPYLERALQAEPRANRLHYPLAMAHRATGNTSAMQHHLEQVGQIGISPDDPAAEYLRAHVQGWRVHFLHGRRAFKAGDLEAAHRAFFRALEAGPKEAVIWSSLGMVDVERGRIADAVTSLQRALELDPGLDTTRQTLVRLLTLQGELAAARTLIEEATASAADPVPWLRLRAGVNWQSENFAAAADDFMRVFEQDGNPADWLAALQALVESGRHDEAGALAMQIAPDEDRLGELYGLVDQILDAAAASPADLHLAGELAQYLVDQVPDARHARLRVESLLRGSGECAVAQRWLTARINQPALDEAYRQALRQLAQALGRHPACPSEETPTPDEY